MMDALLHMLYRVLSGPVALVAAAVLFTYSSFYWLKQLLREADYSPSISIPFGILNGSIALLFEYHVSTPAPYLIMILVPLVTVCEVNLVSRDSLWGYMTMYVSFTINFCCIHNIAVAVQALAPFAGDSSSLDARMYIFTLALLLAGAALLALIKLMPAKELTTLLHSPQKGFLLFLYCAISSVVLIFIAGFSVPLYYNDNLAPSLRMILNADLALKSLLILTGSYLIVVLQGYSERFSQKSDLAESALRREKSYRAVVQQANLANYSYNATQNRLESGADLFLASPDCSYFEMIEDLGHYCVYPDDQDNFLRSIHFDFIRDKVESGENNYSQRFRLSLTRVQEMVRLPDEMLTYLEESGEWFWVEARDAYVVDQQTGDLLVYVSIVDVNEMVAQEAQLLSAAREDVLTGLLNRTGLEEKIRYRLAQENARGAIFMIDMDDFKMVNDTFGHPVGDEVIRSVADVIRSVFRDGDVIGRIGGDEFCVFASGLASRQEAERRAAKLVLRGKRTLYAGDAEIITGLSVGVALCPESGRDFETLYANADVALYRAKRGGKDNYRLHSGERSGVVG